MRILSAAVLLLMVLCASKPADAIRAVVGHSSFYQPTAGGRMIPAVETYWQINPATLHYVTNADKMIVGRVKTDITFSDNTGIVKHDQFILQTQPRKTAGELGANTIIDLKRYVLKPGLLHLHLRFTDMADSANVFNYTDSISVPELQNKACFSDFELLDTILDNPAKTSFEKNGRQQVPLCTNFLDDPKHFLHYYIELYGADKLPASEYPLIETVSIMKKESDGQVGAFRKTDTIKAGELTPASGDFDIRGLESGNYYLYASLENGLHRSLANQSFFVQRLNTHPFVDTTAVKRMLNDTAVEDVKVLDLNKTFVAKYNMAQCKAILKMLLPVSDAATTATINGFLKKPDDLYTRYFIYNYFANINKGDPARAWKDFSEKVIAINKQFSSHGLQGYETERGFIYMRYGAPTDVITEENEPGALPYEIWTYNTLTLMNHKDIPNAVFLFYRPTEADDFRLLHCNVAGEAQNSNWRRFLYSGSNQGGNTTGNSRAEQYLAN